MPAKTRMDRNWAKVGSLVFVWSVGVALALSVADGFLRGFARAMASTDQGNMFEVIVVWVSDFRFVAEQLTLCGAVIFAAGKFIETRTTLTVGFDRVDAGRMSINGPDENNVVWVGQRYDSPLEAEAVSEAMKSRLVANAD